MLHPMPKELPPDLEALMLDGAFDGDIGESLASLLHRLRTEVDEPSKNLILLFLSLNCAKICEQCETMLDSVFDICFSPVQKCSNIFQGQLMVNLTSMIILTDVLNTNREKFEKFINNLLLIISNLNCSEDRVLRQMACECLIEVERHYAGMLNSHVKYIYSICVKEKTHALQSYVNLLLIMLHNKLRCIDLVCKGGPSGVPSDRTSTYSSDTTISEATIKRKFQSFQVPQQIFEMHVQWLVRGESGPTTPLFDDPSKKEERRKRILPLKNSSSKKVRSFINEIRKSLTMVLSVVSHFTPWGKAAICRFLQDLVEFADFPVASVRSNICRKFLFNTNLYLVHNLMVINGKLGMFLVDSYHHGTSKGKESGEKSVISETTIVEERLLWNVKDYSQPPYFRQISMSLFMGNDEMIRDGIKSRDGPESIAGGYYDPNRTIFSMFIDEDEEEEEEEEKESDAEKKKKKMEMKKIRQSELLHLMRESEKRINSLAPIIHDDVLTKHMKLLAVVRSLRVFFPSAQVGKEFGSILEKLKRKVFGETYVMRCLREFLQDYHYFPLEKKWVVLRNEDRSEIDQTNSEDIEKIKLARGGHLVKKKILKRHDRLLIIFDFLYAMLELYYDDSYRLVIHYLMKLVNDHAELCLVDVLRFAEKFDGEYPEKNFQNQLLRIMQKGLDFHKKVKSMSFDSMLVSSTSSSGGETASTSASASSGSKGSSRSGSISQKGGGESNSSTEMGMGAEDGYFSSANNELIEECILLKMKEEEERIFVGYLPLIKRIFRLKEFDPNHLLRMVHHFITHSTPSQRRKRYLESSSKWKNMKSEQEQQKKGNKKKKKSRPQKKEEKGLSWKNIDRKALEKLLEEQNRFVGLSWKIGIEVLHCLKLAIVTHGHRILPKIDEILYLLCSWESQSSSTTKRNESLTGSQTQQNHDVRDRSYFMFQLINHITNKDKLSYFLLGEEMGKKVVTEKGEEQKQAEVVNKNKEEKILKEISQQQFKSFLKIKRVDLDHQLDLQKSRQLGNTKTKIESLSHYYTLLRDYIVKDDEYSDDDEREEFTTTHQFGEREEETESDEENRKIMEQQFKFKDDDDLMEKENLEVTSPAGLLLSSPGNKGPFLSLCYKISFETFPKLVKKKKVKRKIKIRRRKKKPSTTTENEETSSSLLQKDEKRGMRRLEPEDFDDPDDDEVENTSSIDILRSKKKGRRRKKKRRRRTIATHDDEEESFEGKNENEKSEPPPSHKSKPERGSRRKRRDRDEKSDKRKGRKSRSTEKKKKEEDLYEEVEEIEEVELIEETEVEIDNIYGVTMIFEKLSQFDEIEKIKIPFLTNSGEYFFILQVKPFYPIPGIFQNIKVEFSGCCVGESKEGEKKFSEFQFVKSATTLPPLRITLSDFFLKVPVNVMDESLLFSRLWNSPDNFDSVKILRWSPTDVHDFIRDRLSVFVIDSSDDNKEEEAKDEVKSLIFLPPRYHLMFTFAVDVRKTVVTIKTDFFQILAYVDDFLVLSS